MGVTPKEDLSPKELFPRNKPSQVYKRYSFEDLSLILDKTRSAIVEVVKQNAIKQRSCLKKPHCDANQKSSFG
jgi:hypothetical protein